MAAPTAGDGMTIDHPLLEAERIVRSLFAEPGAVERARDEWLAGPRTAARLRESIFEILGPGYRGCVPVAIEAVLDPETIAVGFGEANPSGLWAVLGPIDDSSVLELEGGDWFGDVTPAPDRAMVVVLVDEESAADTSRKLAEGRHPIWAVPAVDAIDVGSEADFRRYMAEPE